MVVYIFPDAGGPETDIIFGIYDDAGVRFPISGSDVGRGFVENKTTPYGNPGVAVADDGSVLVTCAKDDGTNQDLEGRKMAMCAAASFQRRHRG